MNWLQTDKRGWERLIATEPKKQISISLDGINMVLPAVRQPTISKYALNTSSSSDSEASLKHVLG